MKREFLLKGRSVFYTLLIFLSIGMTFALQAESSS